MHRTAMAFGLALVTAACQHPRPAPTPAPAPAAVAPATAAPPPPAPAQPLLAAPAIDWAAIDLADEAAVLRAWQALDLRGRTWELTLEAVPDEPALLQALATTQLRHANLDCPSQGRAAGCAPDPGVYAAAPDATWVDPCLQRELALWSVAQLEWPDLAAEPELLRRLVSRRGDPDLAAAVLDAMSDLPTALQVELITAAVAAGNRAATVQAVGRLPPEEVPALALALDLDDAFTMMTPATDGAAMRAGMLDAGLQPLTRVALMRALVEAARAAEDPAPALRAELRALARQATPIVAATALHELALLGEARPGRLVPPPRTTAELVRQLGMRALAGEPLGALAAPGGVEAVTIAADPLQPDAAPTRSTARWLATEEVPFGEAFITAAGTCVGATCQAAAGATLAVETTRRSGHLALKRVTRTDAVACPPAPATGG